MEIDKKINEDVRPEKISINKITTVVSEYGYNRYRLLREIFYRLQYIVYFIVESWRVASQLI